MQSFLTPVGATNPVVFGVQVFVSILGSLFGGIFGGADTASINAALTQLRNALVAGVDAVKRFAWVIANGLGAVLAALEQLWTGFLDKLWSLLKKLAALMGWLLHDFLPKLLQIMHKLREWVNYIYVHYIRRILNYLQIIRRYLFILRLFHVKWAGKLDQWIVTIEGKIIGPYLYVLRTLNGLGQWINVILTARGLIQRPILSNSMYAYQRDWVSMFWVGQTSTSAAPPASSGPPAVNLPSNQQSQANWDVYAKTGGGPMAETIQQSFAYAAQAGFTG